MSNGSIAPEKSISVGGSNNVGIWRRNPQPPEAKMVLWFKVSLVLV